MLDFTTLLPGPLATLMLAEAGADVIKVERPGGEDMRRFEPRWEGESAAFALLNRNKRGLEADLKNPAHLSQIKEYLGGADILVEQFRPGVMERLELGYAAARTINPRLIYCSITGFGQDGPYAHRAGYDYIIQGMGGLMSVTGLPGQGPVRVGIPIADLTAGIFLAQGILVALLEREQSGRGRGRGGTSVGVLTRPQELVLGRLEAPQRILPGSCASRVQGGLSRISAFAVKPHGY